MKTNLITRKDIIQYWLSQSEEDLNSFCCPNCRDLLYSHKKTKGRFTFVSDVYYCHNEECSNFNILIER